MMSELIGEAIALAGVAITGYGVGVHNERQREQEPKTFEQLAREQRVKPWRPGEKLPGEPMSDEEWTAWQDAMEEVRGR